MVHIYLPPDFNYNELTWDNVDDDKRKPLGCFNYYDDNLPEKQQNWPFDNLGDNFLQLDESQYQDSSNDWKYPHVVDVDVRMFKKRGVSESSLFNYWDKIQHPDNYDETVAPLDVQFYFYPRPSKFYNSDGDIEYYDVFDEKDVNLLMEDFRDGYYYLAMVDWGDGSQREYNDEPLKLGYDTIARHNYERAGIYEITGYMIRVELGEDNETPIGVVSNTKFTIRININEELDDEFEYLGGTGYSFIPYQDTTPIIGGISENSLYYNSISRQLGDGSIETYFDKYSDRLNSENALYLMNESKNGSNIQNYQNSVNDIGAGELIFNGLYNKAGELGSSIGFVDLQLPRFFKGVKPIWEMLGFNGIYSDSPPEEAGEIVDSITADDFSSNMGDGIDSNSWEQLGGTTEQFDEIDIDDDGVISYEELLDFCDINGDGVITLSEWLESGLSEELYYSILYPTYCTDSSACNYLEEADSCIYPVPLNIDIQTVPASDSFGPWTWTNSDLTMGTGTWSITPGPPLSGNFCTATECRAIWEAKSTFNIEETLQSESIGGSGEIQIRLLNPTNGYGYHSSFNQNGSYLDNMYSLRQDYTTGENYVVGNLTEIRAGYTYYIWTDAATPFIEFTWSEGFFYNYGGNNSNMQFYTDACPDDGVNMNNYDFYASQIGEPCWVGFDCQDYEGEFEGEPMYWNSYCSQYYFNNDTEEWEWFYDAGIEQPQCVVFCEEQYVQVPCYSSGECAEFNYVDDTRGYTSYHCDYGLNDNNYDDTSGGLCASCVGSTPEAHQSCQIAQNQHVCQLISNSLPPEMGAKCQYVAHSIYDYHEDVCPDGYQCNSESGTCESDNLMVLSGESQPHPGNPASPSYWKKIIPKDYDIYINRVDLEWDDNYYYPTLPTFNADGSFSENIGEKMLFGTVGRNWNEDDESAAVTNEQYQDNDLILNYTSEYLDRGVLEDMSGYDNVGMCMNDYRLEYDEKTIQPIKKNRKFKLDKGNENKAF